ncbi:BTAD domain-containing putative transcriptional regulator [Actinoplanes palleronii]|uniref:SARP family transcriptional regulator n=2 Tax=Actinoplanes palleronii TaxID=113570 RepID=A0ABQ4B9L6_9ACTN|nr:SARP family transcriptional regulator [Actinoplanes palleronii]
MDGGARLRITLLGAFRVARGDVDLPVPGARLRGLVVRLALAGGRAVEPGVLIDAIWGEDPPADATHALQALVSRLRRALGAPGDVAQVAGGYRLAVDPADVDALRFEHLAAAGRDRLRGADPAASVDALGAAVALWGADPGAEPSAVAAVAPAAATRLAAVSVEAVADLADAELSLGHAEAAAARLTTLLVERPVHERAAALLIDALSAQGRQAEALGRYEQVREALAAALGAEPGAALRERHLRLLHAPADEQPAPALGGADRWSERDGLGNLPMPLTSFVGREDDLARIDTLFGAGGRLVTVLGPGGAGKTRLAVEAARRHRHEHRDGAWLIDLAAVTEPGKIGAAVLAGSGLRGGAMFDARQRAEGDERDVLVDQLGGRRILLVVDNCEHLIDAVANLIGTLLTRCPGLHVLATSREPLAIDGEALVPLGPLTLPGPDDDAEQAGRTASVRLFRERSAAVRPGFAVDAGTLIDVVRVVRGLDGLPLALELAAARLRTLSLAQLADGLSDRFRLLVTGSRTALPRHRTLGAVIAWSWELLSASERTVAERIAILPGGVTAASATAVCAGTVVPDADVPDLLAALVDRSLLHLAPEPGRYRMLETIREYGTERLTETDQLGAVRDLAAGHVADLIARNDPLLRGPGQLAAARVIGAEYDNALAALRRRCETGDAAGAIALALSLTWYWQIFGRTTDAAHWLGAALAVPAAPGSPGSPGGPAVPGSPGGGTATDRDLARAIQLFSRADAGPSAADEAQMRELAGRLRDVPGMPGLYSALMRTFLGEDGALGALAGSADVWTSGVTRMFRAQFAENAGRLDETRADVAAALTCFGQAGDRWGRAATLPMRAQLRQYDDDLDGALADLAEARALAAEFGALSLSDQVYLDLHWIDLHLRRGDTGPALAGLDAARERVRRAASGWLLILLDVREASFRTRLGDLGRARELLAEAERGLRGVRTFPRDHGRTLVACVRAELALRTGDPAGARTALTEAYAAGLASRDLPMLAVVAVQVAAVAGALGRARESAVLLGVASRLRGAHDRTEPLVRELTARGRAELGEDSFGTAYTGGWHLDAETAVTATDPSRLR